jgi:transposase InsO family protein
MGRGTPEKRLQSRTLRIFPHGHLVAAWSVNFMLEEMKLAMRRSYTGETADAERLDGEFRRPAARQVFERELVPQPGRRQSKIRAWRDEYNGERPHRSLGYRTPNKFAEWLKSSVTTG